MARPSSVFPGPPAQTKTVGVSHHSEFFKKGRNTRRQKKTSLINLRFRGDRQTAHALRPPIREPRPATGAAHVRNDGSRACRAGARARTSIARSARAVYLDGAASGGLPRGRAAVRRAAHARSGTCTSSRAGTTRGGVKAVAEG